LKATTAEIEAGLDRVAITLDKSVLRAPFDGRIAARRVDEGTVLSAGAPVLQLLETARPQLRVGLPESRREALTPGRTVVIDHRGTRIAGTVAAVRPDVDPSTQSILALVDLADGADLSFGAVARLMLHRPLGAEGWVVPLEALKEGRRGLWTVLTVREPEAPGAPSEAGQETVEVLAVTDGRAFVRGTLREGMAVVVEGRHRVTRGDAVEPRPAAQPLQLSADDARADG